MQIAPRWGRLTLPTAVAIAVMTATLPTGAMARRPRIPSIALADVGAQDGNGMAAEALRRVLETALRELRGVRIAPVERADFVVRASITNLKHSRTGSDSRVDCQVSVVVSDAHGGAMRLLLSGRGAAQGALARGSLATQALTAAVRGALRPMGNSLVALR